MNRKLPLLLAFFSILIATLACNFVVGGSKEMSLDNLHMAFDQDGNNPTSVYALRTSFMLWVI